MNETAWSSYGETEASVRFGRVSVDNITRRETKRQSGRNRDVEYQRRFSSSSPVVIGTPLVPLGGVPWPRGEVPTLPYQTQVSGELVPSRENTFPYSPAPQSKGGQCVRQKEEDQPYPIMLICEGQSVTHLVWPAMGINQLVEDAGAIFGIDPEGITLLLAGGIPEVLRRNSTIYGPPRVAPGLSVMVLLSSSCSTNWVQSSYRPFGNSHYQQSVQVPLANSKLLSTFKLPKFDGMSKSWKTWDRAFQRFLGLHQLDHVLEEGFLLTIWSSPGAKEANKMVYFLLEDAVTLGSLAFKYIRQAAKWNGHEAYVLLHNGYVFSGPQTATILLAELAQLRLKRDENASVFCLRLVELIEDLETIPGASAVILTEQQKLGYLLSAIRHEHSLQSVYSQLQSEQLRGTVTFDMACRELHFRCEAIRADEFLDSRPGKVLISTELKKKG